MFVISETHNVEEYSCEIAYGHRIDIHTYVIFNNIYHEKKTMSNTFCFALTILVMMNSGSIRICKRGNLIKVFEKKCP